MILGGVFARYPGLKLVLTEQWMDWAPRSCPTWTGSSTAPPAPRSARRSPKPPSEYFRQNCYIGASFMSNGEAKLGVEHDLTGNVMWGDDYPHAEGTWPDTREAMRFTFSDVDPKYTRQFLGDTAIDLYGLDRDKLQEIADRIGPTVTDLSSALRVARGRDAGASTPSAPVRASSSDGRGRRAGCHAVPDGHPRGGRASA